MEREGYVSIWIGIFSSDSELQKYLELGFTDDGDYIPSQFMKDYNIDVEDFEEDFLERNWINKATISINELIKRCSYEDRVLNEINTFKSDHNIEKLNTAVLLYNFQYDGKIECIEYDDCTLRFYGFVKFS